MELSLQPQMEVERFLEVYHREACQQMVVFHQEEDFQMVFHQEEDFQMASYQEEDHQEEHQEADRQEEAHQEGHLAMEDCLHSELHGILKEIS
jgi:hypothetical protein